MLVTTEALHADCFVDDIHLYLPLANTFLPSNQTAPPNCIYKSTVLNDISLCSSLNYLECILHRTEVQDN